MSEDTALRRANASTENLLKPFERLADHLNGAFVPGGKDDEVVDIGKVDYKRTTAGCVIPAGTWAIAKLDDNPAQRLRANDEKHGRKGITLTDVVMGFEVTRRSPVDGDGGLRVANREPHSFNPHFGEPESAKDPDE